MPADRAETTISTDDLNDIFNLIAGAGTNWNRLFVDALATYGFGLLPLEQAERLGLMGKTNSPIQAPWPTADDPIGFPNPSVIVPLQMATHKGTADD